MKYCQTCGSEIMDTAVICPSCGCAVSQPVVNQSVNNGSDGMDTVIKVFLIIGCVAVGWTLIPLSWCLPITISIFKKLKNGESISTGLKVCTLLFVNLIAGILLLCRKDPEASNIGYQQQVQYQQLQNQQQQYQPQYQQPQNQQYQQPQYQQYQQDYDNNQM